jgi:hypothetical protein
LEAGLDEGGADRIAANPAADGAEGDVLDSAAMESGVD